MLEIRMPTLTLTHELVFVTVLKTGPDRQVRPVEPETGVESGSVFSKNRKFEKSDQKPETGGSIG